MGEWEELSQYGREGELSRYGRVGRVVSLSESAARVGVWKNVMNCRSCPEYPDDIRRYRATAILENNIMAGLLVLLLETVLCVCV